MFFALAGHTQSIMTITSGFSLLLNFFYFFPLPCPSPPLPTLPLPLPLSPCQAASGKKRVLFVGITCGLSAPFVAGQLDHCLSNPDIFTPVLVGFNPTSFARWGLVNCIVWSRTAGNIGVCWLLIIVCLLGGIKSSAT